MQPGHILALHLGDPHPAERGVDEELHRPAALPLGAGLAVGADILFEEPPAEIGHDRPGPALRLGLARTDALFRPGQDLQRRRPGLVQGDAAVLADGEPAQPAAHEGLEDVVLPARLADPDAEAGQLAVPVDGVGAVGPEGSTALLVSLGMRFARADPASKACRIFPECCLIALWEERRTTPFAHPAAH